MYIIYFQITKMNKSGESCRICLIHNDLFELKTSFDDSSELIEVFDKNGCICKQIFKPSIKSVILNDAEASKWQMEIGKDSTTDQNCEIRENSKNPTVARVDTHDFFQFRIRNFKDSFGKVDVSIDVDGDLIIVKSSNKKYYKRIYIPDLSRVVKVYEQFYHKTIIKPQLNPAELEFYVKFNALIINVRKPRIIEEYLSDSFQFCQREGVKV